MIYLKRKTGARGRNGKAATSAVAMRGESSLWATDMWMQIEWFLAHHKIPSYAISPHEIGDSTASSHPFHTCLH